MKRWMSGALCISLVIGSLGFGPVPAQAATKTPGEILKGYGLVSGYDNGSLGESDQITRAQMMVLLAQLNGESEQAKYYAIPSKFQDVDPYAWYAPYVAYATAKGWTAGISKTKFGPNQNLTTQEALAFMIKTLGYTITNYNGVADQAKSLGIINAAVNLKQPAVRGSVFSYMLSSLAVNTKTGGQSLASKLGVILTEKPAETVKSYNLATVTALNQNVIEVKTSEENTYADKTLFALKDQAGSPVTIQSAKLVDAKTIWLKVDGLKTGVFYSLEASNKLSFYNYFYDNAQPNIIAAASVALTNNKLRVTFSEAMDPEMALDTANYSVNGISVLTAAYEKNADGVDKRDVVLLTTTAQTENTSYTLTVAKTMADLAGNLIKSETSFRSFAFTGLKRDVTSPKLVAAQSVDGKHVRLLFSEDSDLDKSTVLNVNNYSVANKSTGSSTLTISAAERVLSSSGSGKYNEILLTTSLQTFGQMYEISVKNLADEFGNIISPTADYKTLFYGQIEDTVSPTVQSAFAISNNKVVVTFSKKVSKASAEQILNYSFTKSLTILKAELDPQDNTRVYLTTIPMTYGEIYKLSAVGVQDQNGNTLATMASNIMVIGLAADEIAPTIQSAVSSVENGYNYLLVTYSEAVESSLASNPQNYMMTDGLGAAIDVTYVSPSTYKIKTPAQTSGKSYALTVSQVRDLAGNLVKNPANGYAFTGQSVSDFAALTVTGAAALNQKTVTVVFNKPVKAAIYGTAVLKDDLVTDQDASDPDNYKIFAADGTTLVASPQYAVVSADKMSVSLRLSVNLTAGNQYVAKVNASETGDGFDGAVTTVVDLYNKPVKNTGALYTVLGNSIVLSGPRVLNASAANNEEVQIKFNMPISVAGLQGSDIVFTASGKTTMQIDAANTKVSPQDNTILVCKVAGTLSVSTAYQAMINGVTKVKDQFGDALLDSTFGGGYASFAVPNVTSVGPRITNVDNSTPNTILITYNEAIDSADIVDYVLTTLNNQMRNPSYVEFANVGKTQVKLYYNPSWVGSGQVYSLKVLKNTVFNTIGKSNDADLSEYYVSNTQELAAVTMTKSLDLSSGTFRINFSRPVADVKNIFTGSDLTLSNVPAGSNISILSASINGTPVDVTNHIVGINTYFDTLDLRVDKLLTTDVAYQLGFDTNLATLQTKEGAALPGTTVAAFSGGMSLSGTKVTAGLTVSQAASQYFASVVVTDANINVPAVKANYTKVLTLYSASNLAAYDTNLGVISAFNNADLAQAKVKGITMETSTGAAGTYDFIVFFLDNNNEVLGWGIQKGLSIN